MNAEEVYSITDRVIANDAGVWAGSIEKGSSSQPNGTAERGRIWRQSGAGLVEDLLALELGSRSLAFPIKGSVQTLSDEQWAALEPLIETCHPRANVPSPHLSHVAPATCKERGRITTPVLAADG